MMNTIKIEVPESDQKKLGITEETPLVVRFEDGALLIDECDEEFLEDMDEDYDPDELLEITINPIRYCVECDHYCRAHQMCLKGVPIDPVRGPY